MKTKQKTTIFLLLLFVVAFVGSCNNAKTNKKINSPFIQELNLDKGWNAVSFFVMPEKADSIQDILKPIMSDFNRVESAYGVHHGAFSLQAKQDNIGAFMNNTGYLIKVDDATILNVTGELNYQDTIMFKEVMKNHCGNYAGYYTIPGDKPLGAEELKFNDGFELMAIHDFRAGSYLPKYDVNDIGLLEPGKSYLFVYNQAGMMYAEEPKGDIPIEIKAPAIYHSPVLPKEWTLGSINPFFTLLIFPTEVFPDPKDGDFVGLFTEDGLCCGVEPIRKSNKYTVVCVYAYDAYAASIDGFKEGQSMVMKYYHNEDQMVEEFIVFDENDEEIFYYDWDPHLVGKIDVKQEK